jgi:hypothetical protein
MHVQLCAVTLRVAHGVSSVMVRMDAHNMMSQETLSLKVHAVSLVHIKPVLCICIDATVL